MHVRHMHAVPCTYIHMYMNLEQQPAAAAGFVAVIQVDSTHTAASKHRDTQSTRRETPLDASSSLPRPIVGAHTPHTRPGLVSAYGNAANPCG
jgi:hypothetical protein